MAEQPTAPLEGRRYRVLSAVMLGSIMGPIDSSIVNVVLPTVAQSFGVGISTAQWVPMIYLLTISSLLLFYGRLGDILGYRRVYLAGLAGFVVASVLCGLAPTIQTLIAARAIQGLAAGLMMAVQYAILIASFPPAERGKALGINAISISAGLAIGPSLGGLLTHLWGWRAVFLINVPIGVAGLLWGRRVIPTLRGQPGKIDVPGVVSAFVALFSLLFLINRFQSLGIGTASGALLLVVILAAAAFFWVETRAAQPMLNLRLFRNRTFSFASLSTLLNFMSQYVMVFLTPFYLQRVLHNASGGVGLIMTSFPLAVMAVAPFAGALSDRTGPHGPACVGAALSALALTLMGGLSTSARPADVAWRLALFGLGTGMFQSPNNSAVMGNVPRPHLGIASGILATMRNVGMVLGIALAGAVLYAAVPAAVLQRVTLDGPDAAAFLAGLRYAYRAGAALAAIAAVTSLVRRKEAKAGG